MIEYFRGPYGTNLLLRWHGSALAKAFIPGLLSSCLYLLLRYTLHFDLRDSEGDDNNDMPPSPSAEYLNHPYAIGVLVASVSFLITFRANYGYQRYWESCGVVHQMMAKWMDATVHASVFHLQSEKYDKAKPPSFYDWEELNCRGLTRDREKVVVAAVGGVGDEEWKEQGSGTSENDESDELDEEGGEVEESARSIPQSYRPDSSINTLRRRRYQKSINETESTRQHSERGQTIEELQYDETRLLGPGRLDGGWGLLYPNKITGEPTATYYDIQSLGSKASRIPPPKSNDGKGFASTKGGRTPSLFLQELAHLSSLLCAVAMTTLRNDLDDAESPLDVYIPGQPWPEADPVKLPKEVKHRAYPHGRLSRNIRYLLGIDQTKHSRTIYNAARPMLVIGGVSDNEIAFLRRARGPYAKTQLCWAWLTDFVIREHLAGSLGKVGPPIVSRIIQFMSDGMLGYNQARKIMFTPFPFPHAQLSAFFVLIMALAIPFLMNQYANETWLGCVLTFLTVTCLSGLHEVAREMENPFRNAPNDVPLCTLLAFYNEALYTMFAGYHPDSYWNEAEVLKKSKGSTRCDDSTKEQEKGNSSDELVPGVSEDIDPNAEMYDDDDEKKNDTKPASSLIPQSIDDADSLNSLRDMIESQAAKIKELQDRMQNKEESTTAVDCTSVESVESS